MKREFLNGRTSSTTSNRTMKISGQHCDADSQTAILLTKPVIGGATFAP
jgi:hypothetical protein